MKVMRKTGKFLAVIAAVLMMSFAAPAFAVTNPFMDVPLGHWAYDAVAQLAARGIISGFPDGMYRGNQPTTRFEMASVIARTLAIIDMTKASRQDVEMLMRLVVEFKDELDALGVRVDQLDGRVSNLHSRLGGWSISGILRTDLERWRRDNPGNFGAVGDQDLTRGSRGYFNHHHARLYFGRRFGADESIRFQARVGDDDGRGTELSRFFVEFPFFFDAMLTVGRFNWNFEAPYYFATAGISDQFFTPWFTDVTHDGLGLTRNFAFGNFAMFAARNITSSVVSGGDGENERWALAGRLELQPTEQFIFDVGIHAALGDDTTVTDFNSLFNNGDIVGLNTTTLWGGLRFNLNQDISFRGIYYHQRHGDRDLRNMLENNSQNAFRLGVNVDQNVLGFTSLWLSYDYVDRGFWMANPIARTVFLGQNYPGDHRWLGGCGTQVMPWDMRAWRVGATQQWNERWRTWVYFGRNIFRDAVQVDIGDECWIFYARATQWGVNVEYRLNNHVGFALMYVNTRWNHISHWDNHVIRFRTQVTF